MRRAPSVRVLAAVSVAIGTGAVLGGFACGTEAIGSESCRKIEHARCSRAQACGIDLTQPVHRDTPARDEAECERFYDTACLHGLASANDPGTVAVQACVDAISAGDCSVVRAPEGHPSCAFLIPPNTPDASDAEAGEAEAGTTVPDAG